MSWVLKKTTWTKPDQPYGSVSILHEHNDFMVRVAPDRGLDMEKYTCILCNEKAPDYIFTQINLLGGWPANYYRTPFSFFTKEMIIAGVFNSGGILCLEDLKYKDDLKSLLSQFKFNINEIKYLTVNDFPYHPL